MSHHKLLLVFAALFCIHPAPAAPPAVESLPASSTITPLQWYDIQYVTTHADLRYNDPAYERLNEAMLRPECDELAMKLTGMVVDAWNGDEPSPAWFDPFLSMIEQRAGMAGARDLQRHPCIDGAYLKVMAEIVMAHLNDAPRSDVNRVRNVLWVGSLIDFAVQYARLHPNDRALRDPLVELLSHCAMIENWPRWEGIHPPGDDFPPVGLTGAWNGLLSLGVLHEGMTIDQAVEILGPTRRSNTWISWYYSTPRHVNPLLTAEIRDNKIISFTVTRG